MEWSDEGIVLSARPHGETSAIAEVFTRDHGRALGVVRGGRSRQMRPVLQVGNHVDVNWTARLAEHLGNYRIELRRSHAAIAMAGSARLAAVTVMASHLRHLPERDAHANLYEITQFLLGFLDDDGVWPALFIRWELAFLEALGFGLDLNACAVTGQNDCLRYVSPRSGRAVSESAGEAYAAKLFILPQFLSGSKNAIVREEDLEHGFRLTGYFIGKHIYDNERRPIPEIRERMISYILNGGAEGRA